VRGRALDPETLRVSTNMVARGDSLLGRFAFDAALVHQVPDRVRVRASRAVPGGELLELIQRGDQLTLFFYRDRRCFTGPLDTLPPEVAERLPVDATWLVAAPLIDTVLAREWPSLRRGRAPRWSCWRRDLWLTGGPPRSAGGRGFPEQIWALDPDTLTVEAAAFRLPGEKPLWLTMRFEEYRMHTADEVAGLASGETAVLPAAFRVSLARRPWRRWWRGELWSIETHINRFRLNRPVREEDFTWTPPAGVEVLPLTALQVR
jgi:hypothetical protein